MTENDVASVKEIAIDRADNVNSISTNHHVDNESVKLDDQESVTTTKESLTRVNTYSSSRKRAVKQNDETIPELHRLFRFNLYETNARYFITGADVSDRYYKVLKIDRTCPPDQLALFEDGITYDKQEINELLTAIDDGNKATGGLRHKLSFWGILGFIRFTEGYYMLIITKRQQVAMLGGHYVYKIEAIDQVTLTSGAGYRFTTGRNAEETKFLAILNNLDLSKNFYFSYTYNITKTLQNNMIRERFAASKGNSPAGRDYNDMFVWNHHLLTPAKSNVENAYDWCIPIMHGFISQSSINVFGRIVYVTIIGRRSRFFAGARFLKRGVNDLGYVANDVETEQIVSEMLTTSFHGPGPRMCSKPSYTSYVHHRGSIPLYWTQDNSGVTPKPAIDLNLTDPFYQPAAAHFDDLFRRYGCPIYVLNLVKAKERTPRESKLIQELKQAIDYLNQFLPDDKRIIYNAFDMSRASKTKNGDVIGNLERIAAEILLRTDFFHNGYGSEDSPRVQNGIARTNCVDCLDRTNAAQFVIGKHAFGLQLQALGIIETADMEYDSEAIDMFTQMFHDHGDTIAVQYGGSHLVNTIATYRKVNHWQSQGRDMVESFKRYYHNSFLDSQRQEAYNLFLGNYVYVHGQPMLWDLSSDYYLHYSNPKDYLERFRKRKSYIDWYDARHLERREFPPVNDYGDNDERDADHSLIHTDTYWAEYYRPFVLSSFSKIFSYRLSSAKTASAEKITSREKDIDTIAIISPFVPRLDLHRTALNEPQEKGKKKSVSIIDPHDDASEILQLQRGSSNLNLIHTNNRPSSINTQVSSHNQSTIAQQSSDEATLSKLSHPLSFSHPLSSTTTIATTSFPSEQDEEQNSKSLMSTWTLHKIYETSLNPTVTGSEMAEYEHYISHPYNIPLVVMEEDVYKTEDSTVASEYASYLEQSTVITDDSHRYTDEYNDVGEEYTAYKDFVSIATRENALSVEVDDGDKKRYRAYRQWLVRGKSLFKQRGVTSSFL